MAIAVEIVVVFAMPGMRRVDGVDCFGVIALGPSPVAAPPAVYVIALVLPAYGQRQTFKDQYCLRHFGDVCHTDALDDVGAVVCIRVGTVLDVCRFPQIAVHCIGSRRIIALPVGHFGAAPDTFVATLFDVSFKAALARLRPICPVSRLATWAGPVVAPVLRVSLKRRGDLLEIRCALGLISSLAHSGKDGEEDGGYNRNRGHRDEDLY